VPASVTVVPDSGVVPPESGFVPPPSSPVLLHVVSEPFVQVPIPMVHADDAVDWLLALGQYEQVLALVPPLPLMVQQPRALAVGQEDTIVPFCMVQSFENWVLSSEVPPEMPVQISTPAVVTSQ
jgi:hypothetical protein